MILRLIPSQSCTVRKPRVCGDDPAGQSTDPHAGAVNPACAGMIPLGQYPDGQIASKPRVCGDDPRTDLLVPDKLV